MIQNIKALYFQFELTFPSLKMKKKKMQEELNLLSELQIMALQPQEFVNIRQTQEKIKLLRKIANTQVKIQVGVYSLDYSY